MEAVGRGLGRPSLRADRRLANGFNKGFSTQMTVDKIVSNDPQKALANTSIAELVPFLAKARLHHVAVVDETDHLIGLVTQTDLVMALFKGDVGSTSQKYDKRYQELKMHYKECLEMIAEASDVI